MVQVTVQLPDEIARGLSEVPGEIPRRILESVAAEGFRSARLSRQQVGELLDLEAGQIDRFIEDHGGECRLEVDQFDQRHAANLAAFRRELPGLLQAHPGHFVAVTNGRVVDHDLDEMRLVGRVAGQFRGQPVLIQPVEGDGIPSIQLEDHEFDMLSGRPG